VSGRRAGSLDGFLFLPIRGNYFEVSVTERPPVCNYEGSDYQTSFWEKGGREYEDRVEAIALQRLLPASGKLMLELGAGAGRNTPRYQNFDRIVLLDYSRTQLLQAQERLGIGDRYIYVAADIYHLPFAAGLFDAATMIRTLHHMADAPQALRQVRQVLQPGAVFILEYANKQNVKAILRYWAGKQSWSPFSPDPVEFAELNFDFHPKTIRRWMDEAGFKVERQLTVSHFRIGLLKRWAPVDLLVKMDSLAQRTGDWWQLSPSVFLCSYAIGQGAAAAGDAFFCCPECSTLLGLNQQDALQEILHCAQCGAAWSTHGGIYDFRQPVG
jgi:ubiquinone/menaquinone biosynthesis C-methylase UbiE